MQPERKRFGYLDGLRGVGAVQVFLLHATAALFGYQRPYGPEIILADGQLAVFVFFCISGFVLASAYRSPSSSSVRLISARALRLFIPTVCSCLFAFAVWLSVAPLIAHPVGAFDPTRTLGQGAWDTLLYILQTIAIGHPDSSLLRGMPGIEHLFSTPLPALNPALWTIHIEFVGSIVVLALSAMMRSRYRAAVLIIAAAITLRSLLLPFVVGMAIYYYQPRYQHWLVTAGLLIAASVISIAASNSTYFGWAEWVAQIRWILSAQSAFSVQKCAAAILVFVAVVTCPSAIRLLSSANMAVLGRYSFPIYLTHMPILAFVGRPLKEYNLLVGLGSTTASVLAMCLCIGLTAVASEIFLRVDRWSIQLSRKVAKKPMGRPPDLLAREPRIAEIF